MDGFTDTTKAHHQAVELKRLSDNHEVFKEAMGGLPFAPLDLSKPGRRILDSATADGMFCRMIGILNLNPRTKPGRNSPNLTYLH